ncbi:hypothetical protein [Brooklawnia cerclae]|uniref:Uncharacterized protein n=1 Tax=Brooklawnia cerclae TaxID=349934 RepID=A0ABX0SNX4_9ACTN|nr:hypothetical protein [Brooklawnia cerclae]NIH58462.1 hypothetical protein [Brooklawnia cerclae]
MPSREVTVIPVGTPGAVVSPTHWATPESPAAFPMTVAVPSAFGIEIDPALAVCCLRAVRSAAAAVRMAMARGSGISR